MGNSLRTTKEILEDQEELQKKQLSVTRQAVALSTIQIGQLERANRLQEANHEQLSIQNAKLSEMQRKQDAERSRQETVRLRKELLFRLCKETEGLQDKMLQNPALAFLESLRIGGVIAHEDLKTDHFEEILEKELFESLKKSLLTRQDQIMEVLGDEQVQAILDLISKTGVIAASKLLLVMRHFEKLLEMEPGPILTPVFESRGWIMMFATFSGLVLVYFFLFGGALNQNHSMFLYGFTTLQLVLALGIFLKANSVRKQIKQCKKIKAEWVTYLDTAAKHWRTSIARAETGAVDAFGGTPTPKKVAQAIKQLENAVDSANTELRSNQQDLASATLNLEAYFRKTLTRHYLPGDLASGLKTPRWNF
jgi:hypothetical protein